MRRGIVMTLAATLVMLAGWTSASAQDRPIYVADTDPAPAVVERGTFFTAGSLVTARVRNRHTAPVLITLRTWIFDQSGRFKGTSAHCFSEPLERGTWRVFSMPLEVQPLVFSDAVTVSLDRVVADGRVWTPVESVETSLAVARRQLRGGGGALRLDERRTVGLPAVICPCECQSTAAACETQCVDTGLRAFTCTPVNFDGCSASCTCK